MKTKLLLIALISIGLLVISCAVRAHPYDDMMKEGDGYHCGKGRVCADR